MPDDRNRSLEWLYEALARLVLFLLAAVALAGAAWRMLTPDREALSRLDGTTLLYLGVAGALLLLKDVKSLAFGDYKVEFERVREIAREAKNAAENAQSTALGIGKAAEGEGRKMLLATEEITPGNVPGDPWKGQFGGASQRNNRELQAEVARIPGSSGLFSVRLRVISTLPKPDPLRGVVQFFLHPTFKDDRPIVTVGPDGVAELKVTSWGAFTVGALADAGGTKLELDLAELEDAPMEFRNR